jgi:hypothetical protein
MGMRFMQRKNEANNKGQEERRAVAAAARKMDRNHATNTDTMNSIGLADGKINRKRESEEIPKDDGGDGDNDDENGTRGAIILELASVVDMYGVGSDVVGRRSFGGFHKSVMNTWNTALKRRTDDDTRTKNTKNHITDEELLERYEKYVKGRGGAEADGSGNRGRKEKRKRNT